jgi:hypothetical protein
MSKKFRISSKRIFLTYPQFNSTKDDIKEQLFQVLTNYLPFDYCISQEIHKDGNLHFHVFLQSKSKFNIKNTNVLKLKTLDGIFKSGDYQSVKNKKAVLQYIIKNDKQPLTNIIFDLNTGYNLSLEEKTIQIYRKQGYQSAINFYRDNASDKDLLKKYNNIQRTLSNLHKNDMARHNQMLNYVPLNLTKFITDHTAGKLIEHWHNKQPDKTLYLHGRPGIGKTEALKTYLASKLESPDQLGFVRHFEDLKKIINKKTLLFDDVHLAKIFKKDIEGFIHLLDRRNPSPIRVLYDVITIKRGVRTVILSNISFNKLLILLKVPSEQINAIKRRTTVVEAKESFPLTIVNEENFQETKNNSDIFHPNWEELEINIKISLSVTKGTAD